MRSALRLLPRLTASAFLGGLLFSRFAVPHNLPLPDAMNAPRGALDLPGFGTLSYYADTHAPGRPLLLLHSVNAAASAYEMQPIFEAYRAQRPVYALDLPGFGFSARPDTAYTPELYARAIHAVLAHIGTEVDVVALSLGAEFAARAALADRRVRSLTLISPSGLGRARRGTQEVSAQGRSGRVYRWLAFALWGQALYDLIASRASIQYFLRQSFEGPVNAGLEAYAYPTSHQPGARYAPLHFISGLLFTRGAVEEIYTRLTQPTLIIYDQDAFVGFDRLPALVSDHANIRAVQVTPTRGLPQFERLPEVRQALDHFWQHPEVRTIT